MYTHVLTHRAKGAPPPALCGLDTLYDVGDRDPRPLIVSMRDPAGFSVHPKVFFRDQLNRTRVFLKSISVGLDELPRWWESASP